MNVTVTPRKLQGTIIPPPSKSQAHRALIAAALAGGESQIENLADSQDILATRRCMAALRSPGIPLLDCGESGSTLRFLIPVTLVLRGACNFTGGGRLLERPLDAYNTAFKKQGISLDFAVQLAENRKILRTSGHLKSGIFEFPGDVSSQFITGMLFALPLAEGDSKIMLTTSLESRGYVDMTLDVLERFGIRVENQGYQSFLVPGGQRYHPHHMTVESDYSQAAFFLCANGLGSDIHVSGLNPASVQGDRIILDYVNKLSGKGTVVLDVSQCPDLVPALAAYAALRENEETHIVNAARLRMKESDRLDTVTTELCSLGARVEQTPDSLVVHGVRILTGGTVCAHNDHRIAMMLAVAATCAAAPVTITGAECVNKSYPTFWEDYGNLGGVFV